MTMSPTPPTAEVVIDGASDDVVEAEGSTGDGRDETRGRSAMLQASQASSASQASASSSAQSTATTTAEPDHGSSAHGTSSADAVTHDDPPPAEPTDDAPLNPYIVHDDTSDTPDAATDTTVDHPADGTDSAPE